MRARALRLLFAAVLCLCALLGGCAGRADAKAYVPPAGKVFTGVTAGADVADYRKRTRSHPAVWQFFVAWDDSFEYAIRKAQAARSRLMLHISTSNGPGSRERITPLQIARGGGDEYLTTLARRLATLNAPVYVRPLSEMNNAANPYAPYGHDGRPRGREHSTAAFRQAWRRMAIILRGGSYAQIDAQLRRARLPILTVDPARSQYIADKADYDRQLAAWKDREYDRQQFLASLTDLELEALRYDDFDNMLTPEPQPAAPGPAPTGIPRPKVAMMWVPMTAGSPNIPQLMPRHFWPGRRYVDWVGTDFYSRFPNFRGLDGFYARWAARQKLPFAFGEFSMWGKDNPAFARRFFGWVKQHKRVRMLQYNQGHNPAGPFRLKRFPKAAKVIRRALADRHWATYAPEHRRR